MQQSTSEVPTSDSPTHDSRLTTHDSLHGTSGYVLYLVLIVLGITGIFLTICIRGSVLSRILCSDHLQKTQAKLLAYSGLARVEYFMNGGDFHDLHYETESLTEEIPGYGFYQVRCRSFGLYSAVRSTGSRFKKKHAVENIFGRDIPDALSPAITLTGDVGGLVLSHGTQIPGKIIVHHGTLTRDDAGTPIPGAEAWVTRKDCPPLPYHVDKIDRFIAFANRLLNDAGSGKAAGSGGHSAVVSTDTAVQRKMDTIITGGEYTIQGTGMNNSVVVAGEKITMLDGAACTRCFLYSKQIEVRGGKTDECVLFSTKQQYIRGGTHRSQFIATDSIVLDHRASFADGNVWVSKPQVRPDTLIGGVFFDGMGVYYGHTICFVDSVALKQCNRPIVVLGTGSRYCGTIVTNGDSDMKDCTVSGAIWTRSFYTVEKGVGYTNWLIRYTHSSLNTPLPYPLLGTAPVHIQTVGN